MEALQRYFTANKLVEEEYEKVELKVEGQIPLEIRGTLFRNGNGRFEHKGVKYDHLFDGDGMVAAFQFKDGKVFYSNKHVRTAELMEEEKADKMLYRSFGTNLPGGIRSNFLKMKFKNVANTSVVWHGGKMLALWEGGLPHEIDPETLDTIQRYDYDGVLRNDFSFVDKLITPELPFSAHPKIHPQTGVMYNFGTAAGTKQRLVIYKVMPDGTASIDKAIEIPEVTFTHDFVLTNRGRKVFFLTPVAFDLFKAFAGIAPPVAAMNIDRSKKTKILIIEPDGTEKYAETDFCFVFHFANGYDLEDDKVVVDGYIMPDFPSAESIKAFVHGRAVEGPMPVLKRYTIDLNTLEIKTEKLSDHPGELPNVNPQLEGKPYRYSWNIATEPNSRYFVLRGLAKTDTFENKTFYKDFAPNLTGEPIMIPADNATQEDDGYLLTLFFDAEAVKTRLLVLDARDFSEIARMDLPHNIPLGFHGLWVDEKEMQS